MLARTGALSENVAALPGTTAQAMGNCLINHWFVIPSKRAIDASRQ
jgi:hypothetical protein